MAKDEGDDLLPDKDAAKGFYAKYEPKEILGRFVICYCLASLRLFSLAVFVYTRTFIIPQNAPNYRFIDAYRSFRSPFFRLLSDRFISMLLTDHQESLN